MPGSGRRQYSQGANYSTLPPITLGHSNSQGNIAVSRNMNANAPIATMAPQQPT